MDKNQPAVDSFTKSVKQKEGFRQIIGEIFGYKTANKAKESTQSYVINNQKENYRGLLKGHSGSVLQNKDGYPVFFAFEREMHCGGTLFNSGFLRENASINRQLIRSILIILLFLHNCTYTKSEEVVENESS